MSKHISVPWVVMGMGGRFVITTTGPTSRAIADCGNGFDGFRIDNDLKNECRDNAHLFAKARETAAERDALKELNAELLAALNTAVSEMRDWHPNHPSMSQILDAIAKAEDGECTTPK